MYLIINLIFYRCPKKIIFSDIIIFCIETGRGKKLFERKNQIDNKVQIEDKTVSDSHDMEAVEFLDHINFDTPDFDDDEIDYIEESI